MNQYIVENKRKILKRIFQTYLLLVPFYLLFHTFFDTVQSQNKRVYFNIAAEEN